MISSKFKRIIINIVFAIVLLGLPLYLQIYYVAFYYSGAILLIAFPLLRELLSWNKTWDEKFRKRWRESRKKGFWTNFFWETARNFVLMVIIVSLGQLFGNGLTPMDVVVALSGNELLKVIVLLIVVSCVAGCISWSENEKRYTRLCRNIEQNYY